MQVLHDKTSINASNLKVYRGYTLLASNLWACPLPLSHPLDLHLPCNYPPPPLLGPERGHKRESF